MDTTTKDQPAAADVSSEQQSLARVTPAGAMVGTMVRAFEGLMPQSIPEAMLLATHLAKSNAIPGSFSNKPESVLTVILAGIELGLTPIRSLQSISNIRGNLCMKADLQLALVRRSGLLEYFDEGYELTGRTDSNLADRVDPSYQIDAQKILALVQPMATEHKDPKPYGWCIVHRKGTRPVVRVFTWEDANRVKVADDEGDRPAQGEKRERKPLSEKHNYRNYPQDMYPRRARGRAFQVTFPDILAGLPSHEALADGQVIEGEVVERDSSRDDADDILKVIEAADADLAGHIRRGFDNLAMSKTRRLVLLRKFDGDPQALYHHLRDEYAKGQGKPFAQVKTGDKPAASHPVEAAKPVQPAAVVTGEVVASETEPAAGETNPPAAEPTPAAGETKPADPDPPKRGKLSDRFRANIRDSF